MHEEWELQRHGPGKYTDAAGRVVYDGLWERDWPGDWPSAGDKGSWVTEGMQEGFQRWVPDPDQPCAKRTNAEEALASRILELEERGMDRAGFARSPCVCTVRRNCPNRSVRALGRVRGSHN